MRSSMLLESGCLHCYMHAEVQHNSWYRQAFSLHPVRHDKDCSGHLSYEEFHSMCKEMAGGTGKFQDSLLFKATIVLGIKLVALPLASKVLGTKINISAIPPVVTQQAIQMGIGQAVKQFNVPLPL
ncbi:hypothetical protein DUNSADRAFT_9984 [Dunaliella salina]|uniref:EF-hand domain-containing protein n=1 Tax=Dunaliella salina TaxID=3046 RepID=A0ABQ7GGB7_DUNSA|nr:hypothetical protein DUNSADRAFT_9984 [Dunaliella salina]|eukprot:KAF5833641.1 hypothetical protein DUNSADRAFT_9984 [Dunaliella salina]